MNSRAAQLLEITDSLARGGPAIEWLGEARLASLEEQLGEVKRAGGTFVSESTVHRGPFAGRTMRLTRLLFDDSEGNNRLLSIGEDVTPLREATKALEAAVAEAKSANEAKSQFLAQISHEIRTPLNGVIGMAQAMAHDALPELQRQRLEVIRQSGETLLALLDVDYVEHQLADYGHTLQTVGDAWESLARKLCGR